MRNQHTNIKRIDTHSTIIITIILDSPKKMIKKFILFKLTFAGCEMKRNIKFYPAFIKEHFNSTNIVITDLQKGIVCALFGMIELLCQLNKKKNFFDTPPFVVEIELSSLLILTLR